LLLCAKKWTRKGGAPSIPRAWSLDCGGACRKLNEVPHRIKYIAASYDGKKENSDAEKSAHRLFALLARARLESQPLLLPTHGEEGSPWASWCDLQREFGPIITAGVTCTSLDMNRTRSVGRVRGTQTSRPLSGPEEGQSRRSEVIPRRSDRGQRSGCLDPFRASGTEPLLRVYAELHRRNWWMRFSPGRAFVKGNGLIW